MSAIGPVGAEGPHGVGRAQPQASIAKHAFNSLGAILNQLLHALEFGYLPKLDRAERIALMFGAVNHMLTGGDPGAVEWKNLPGPTLAKEKEMGNFLNAWVFFSAALGRSKPQGISAKLWKSMEDLAKKVHLTPQLRKDMKQVLDNPAFHKLFTDVVHNAHYYAEAQKALDARRALPWGKYQNDYNAYQKREDTLRKEIFNTDPSDKTRLKKLHHDLDDVKTKMKHLADTAGVATDYQKTTASFNYWNDKRLTTMQDVRDHDIPWVQMGRSVKGMIPPPPDAQSRYNKLTIATNALATYATGALSRAKVMAQMLAMKVGKLGPILSKLIKQMEKVAQFIIQQKLDESM